MLLIARSLTPAVTCSDWDLPLWADLLAHAQARMALPSHMRLYFGTNIDSLSLSGCQPVSETAGSTTLKGSYMQKSTSIRIKVGAGLVLLTLLLLVSSVINYRAMTALEANTANIAVRMFPAEEAVLNADRDLYQALTAVQEALLLNNADVLAKARQDYDENVKQAYDRMHKFLDLLTPYPSVAGQLTSFETLFASWNKGASEVFTLLQAGKHAEAVAQQQAMSDPFSTLREQYNLAGELAGTLTEQMQSDSQAVVDSRQHITLIIAAISVLIGLILSYVNPRMIVTAVNEVRGKIDDISQGEGDLVSRIPIKTGDELGQLSGSLNRLLDQLQHLIRDVISDVGHLGDQSSGLGRIVHDAEVISDRQHAQLNTLVTAFTEIGHAINDISQHAQQTSAQSQDAQAAANQGMELLEENIAMNNRLSASVQNAGQIVTQLAAESERITSVLDVIRGIAEQTNLLALNAAIEAARAGDQGRGFAVVADEVRTLAGRTQNSTEDIQKMISSLKQQVANAVAAMESGFEQMQASVKMTGQMRGTFSDIQGLVGQVQEMNVQIASATEQQSLVMNEINQGMSQLSELTEEAHRISNSVSQCGQQMESLTGQLSGRVKKFRV